MRERERKRKIRNDELRRESRILKRRCALYFNNKQNNNNAGTIEENFHSLCVLLRKISSFEL